VRDRQIRAVGGLPVIPAWGAQGGLLGVPSRPLLPKRDLITRYDTLVMSGTAFLPDDRQVFRVSFANVDQAGLTDFAGRLQLMAKDLLG
jgi:hypothetical protein